MSTLSVQSITGVSSFDFSNTSFASAYGVANSGYVVANAAFTYGNSSYTVANAAFGVANAGFAKANTALQNTTTTLAGTFSVSQSINVGTGAYSGQVAFFDDGGTSRYRIGVPGSAGARDFFLYDYANSLYIDYYSTGSNYRAFYVAGAEKVRFNGNGLGVGNAPFQYGSSGSVGSELSIQSSNTTNAGLTIQSGLSRYWISTPYNSNVMHIGGNGASTPALGAITIDSGYKVGMGRADPGYKLDVVGTANVSSLHINGQYATPNTSIHGVQTHCIARYFQPNSFSPFYIHFLLPSRYNNTSSRMFLLEFKGYEFNNSAIMNVMIGGYVTPPSNGGPISKIATWDATSRYSPTIYYSSTYNVGVARMTIPTSPAAGSYYLSFTVNAICVGNGDILEPGELTIIESASATL